MRCDCCSFKRDFKKYFNKLLSLYGIKDDSLLSSDFVEDLKSSSNTSIEQIFTYFLENKAYESEYIGQYKLRKIYTFSA